MPLLKLVLRILIIVVIYVIIFFALRIMYKDIKGGNKKKRRSSKAFGLEVIEIGKGNTILKRGSVVPVHNFLSIGRKEDNLLVLYNEYISANHVKIFVKNNECFIEDLKSTNGTLVNDKPIDKVTYLKAGDEISIGEYIFKVL